MATVDTRKKQYYCTKCARTKSGDNFYTSNDKEKYPEDGKLTMCKDCITMHVDNWDPETYLWILKECDVPYLQSEWDTIMRKYAQNPDNVKGTTIIGRYLAKMKLNQYKSFRWKDSEFLQERENAKIKETMTRSGYSAAEIQATIDKGFIPPADVQMPKNVAEPIPEFEQSEPEDYFAKINEKYEEDLDLTEEDKLYLALKWGKAYKPSEWVQMEQFYSEMMESYDIQSAGHIDTLKLICKTSLKCNQLVDMGDVEGYQKMTKVYDTLMKSGNFTAAQNKAEAGEYVDSISALVEICEAEGFIPRYYIDQPNDRVDETLLDIKNYTHSLVTDEMNLGNLIENAVKEMTLQEMKEEDEDIEDELENYDSIDLLKEDDYVEYKDFIENELILDEQE